MNGEKKVAPARMFAHMPVKSLHSFKNESDTTAKMLISIAPAGLEDLFMEVGLPLVDGATTSVSPTKADIDKLLDIAPRFGIEIRVPNHE